MARKRREHARGKRWEREARKYCNFIGRVVTESESATNLRFFCRGFEFRESLCSRREVVLGNLCAQTAVSQVLRGQVSRGNCNVERERKGGKGERERERGSWGGHPNGEEKKRLNLRH